jgi:hypothetical protein
MVRHAPIVVLAGVLLGGPARAFTVKALTQSVGHEFITVEGGHRAGGWFSNPASNQVTGERASCRALCDKYDTRNFQVWSAAMGNRFADVNGWNVITDGGCFDATAQSSDWVQYPHFLRKKTDTGSEGARRAARGGVDYIKTWFLRAASAREESLWIRDGGGSVLRFKVLRPPFYLGIALHALQDSFSDEHTVRTADLKKIVDVKTFVETPSVQRHACPKRKSDKDKFTILTFMGQKGRRHGDHAFVSGTRNAVEELKPTARAAMLATRDLFRAFQQAREARGRAEALWAKFEKEWLGLALRPKPFTGPVNPKCGPSGDIEKQRDRCLAEAGREPVEPNLPRFCWPADKCREDWWGKAQDAFMRAVDGVGKAVTSALKSIGDFFSGVFSAIGDFATTVYHRFDGYDTCMQKHVPSLASRAASEAKARARHRLRDFWQRAQPPLREVPVADRPRAVAQAWRQLREAILREVGAVRERGAGKVRDWFGKDWKKDKASAKFRQSFDGQTSGLAAEMEAAYKAGVR